MAAPYSKVHEIIYRAIDVDDGREDCLSMSYAEGIKRYVNTEINATTTGRQWLYQTCAEFGWYQTTTLTEKLFGNAVTLEYQLKVCADTFGSA